MDQNSLLSLVVPSFNQEKTIVEDIKKLDKTLSEFLKNYEIIVVVDGFIDKSFEKLKKIGNSKIKIFGYSENQGKGYAVKYGILKAKGDVVGFIDAGMDIDPAGIAMLLNHMVWYDADIVVGSKLHPVSQVNYPITRKILSWGYRTFTRLLFGFKVRDTQVGIKFFKKNVAKDLFPRLLVKKFAFDVEILAVSYAIGYKRIYEAPVKLNFSGMSTITSGNLWKTIFFMCLDTLAIFYRIRILKYYKKSNKKNWVTN